MAVRVCEALGLFWRGFDGRGLGLGFGFGFCLALGECIIPWAETVSETDTGPTKHKVNNSKRMRNFIRCIFYYCMRRQM